MQIGSSSLANLAKIRKDVKRKRVSSYDVKGANIDTAVIDANQKHEVCNINGAGCIKHIWMTLASTITDFLRYTHNYTILCITILASADFTAGDELHYCTKNELIRTENPKNHQL